MDIIPTDNDQVILIDDDMSLYCRMWSWHVSEQGYAFRHLTANRRLYNLDESRWLHREIAQAKPGERVGFRDGNRLNCQRENLYIKTRKQKPLDTN